MRWRLCNTLSLCGPIMFYMSSVSPLFAFSYPLATTDDHQLEKVMDDHRPHTSWMTIEPLHVLTLWLTTTGDHQPHITVRVATAAHVMTTERVRMTLLFDQHEYKWPVVHITDGHCIKLITDPHSNEHFHTHTHTHTHSHDGRPPDNMTAIDHPTTHIMDSDRCSLRITDCNTSC
jgi:hypothetical protein